MRTATAPAVDDVEETPNEARSRFDTTSFLILFLLLLFVLPARRVLPGFGAEGRPANLVGIGLAGAWVLAHLSPRLAPRGRQPLRYALFLLTVVALVSYLLGIGRGLLPIEQRSADMALLTALGATGVILAAADGIVTRERFDTLVKWVVYGGAFTSAVAFLQFTVQLDLAPKLTLPGLQLNADLIPARDRGGTLRVPGTAGHSIELGVVAAMILPLALHYALLATDRRQAWRRWGVVVLIATSVPFSGSRAGFVGLAVAVLGMAISWAWPLTKKVLIGLVLGTAVLRAFVPTLLSTMRYLFLHPGEDPSIQTRTEDYAVVLRQIGERPWFGRGFGTYTPEIYRVLDNQLLGSAVSTGLVGVAAYLVLLAVGIGCAGRARRLARRAETAHLAIALRVGIVVGLISPFFFDALSFATFTGLLALYLGMAGALWRLTRDEQPWEGEGVEPMSTVLRSWPTCRRWSWLG